MPEITYPEYDFSFVIEQVLFEQGTLVVKYMPVNTQLTSYTYNIPILPTLDMSNLKEYVKQWTPNDRWFAQEIILNNGTTLLGATS
jgi:hypothetical protein